VLGTARQRIAGHTGTTALIVAVVVSATSSARSSAAAEYAATYSTPTIQSLCPGQTVTVPVTVSNTGTRTWPGGVAATGGFSGKAAAHAAALPDWLTYHIRDDATQVVERDVGATLLPRPVAPGDSITLQVEIVGPRKKGSLGRGTYTVQWEMVHAGLLSSSFGSPPGETRLEMASSIACLSQWITKIEGIITGGPDDIAPGDDGVLIGFELGDGAGEASLVGSFPGGRIPLEIIHWDDGTIEFRVPDDPAKVCGSLDQDAEIEVKTKSGVIVRWPVRFRARRDFHPLRPDEMDVACSDAGALNRCNGQGDLPLSSVAMQAYEGSTASGGHQCGWDSAEGVDTFSIRLINGWVPVYTSSIVGWAPPGEESSYVRATISFDGASWTLTVPWGCTGQGQNPGTAVCMIFVPFPFNAGCLDPGVAYALSSLVIEGPCGVPYR
jgi:hypothetical protein